MSGRSRAVSLALASCLGVAGFGLPVAAAADTPGCVTKQEYRAAETGWKLTRTHHRFDTSGEQVDYYEGDPGTGAPERQTRAYDRCSGDAPVHVDYTREAGEPWRISYKSGW